MKWMLKILWTQVLFVFGKVANCAGVQRYIFRTTASLRPYHLRTREFLDFCLPNDPLPDDQELPKIEIAIPCTSKDIQTLASSVIAAMECSRNAISKINIFVPSSEIVVFQKYLNEELPHIPNLFLKSEEELLGSLHNRCLELAPESRRGWLIQQVVKYLAVLNSSEIGVLVMDADTILNRRRTWISCDKNQLLMMSLEYHKPYQLHYLNFRKRVITNVMEKSPRVSFVTHHQLMQPEVLKKMLGGGTSWRDGLRDWIETIDFSDKSPACEYHCYGTFLITHLSEKCLLARWGNKGLSRKCFDTNTLKETSTRRPRYLIWNSLSYHSYLD